MSGAVRFVKTSVFSRQNLLKITTVRGYLGTGLKELFFPVGNTGAAYQQIEEAKAVCRTCKVIDACLKCALDTNQDYGVWGGLSEDERRALKRRAMRARRSQAMQMQI